MLGEDPQIVMDFVIFLITERYGIHEPHAMSGVLMPCYYVNNTKTFLTIDSSAFLKYGINLGDFSFLSLEHAIQLRNDKSEQHSIGFVDVKTIVNPNDTSIQNEVKDAWERADFILYDYIENSSI